MKNTTPSQPLGPYGALFLALLALLWAARVLLTHGITLALLLAGYRPKRAIQEEAPPLEPVRSQFTPAAGRKSVRRQRATRAAAA